MKLHNQVLSSKVGLHFLVLIILLLSVFITYHPVLNAPFVFDDIHSIVENSKIRDLGNFLTWDSLKDQRPLVDFTFALNFQFADLQVFGYHLVNLIIHGLVSWVVYFLALVILSRLMIGNNSITDRYIIFSAVFGAIIFALHPIQTQAVSYIVQRYTSMAALFYLLSVLFYILARRIQKQTPNEDFFYQNQKESYFGFKVVVLYALTILFALVSFLSKQNAYTLPLVLILVEYILFERNWKKWKIKLFFIIPLTLMFGVFVLYKLGFFQGSFSIDKFFTLSDYHTRETFEISRLEYFFTQLQVICIYLGLLIWPANQCLDHMYPIVHNFWQSWTPWALVFLLGVAGFGLWVRKIWPIVFLAIFLFFITLSVESSFIPISDALVEHRLYLPMFSLALILGWGFFRFVKSQKMVVWIIAFIIIFLLAVTTYQRNLIWQSPVSLWKDTVEESPKNYRAYSNLGKALINQDIDNLEKAKKYFYKSIHLKPDFADGHLNLGQVFWYTQENKKALKYLKTALEIKPDSYRVHYYLALSLQELDKIGQAKKHYRKVLDIKSDHVMARWRLSKLFYSQGAAQRAAQLLKENLNCQPNHFKSLFYLGQYLMEMDQLDQALYYLNKSIAVKDNSAKALFLKALVYYQKKDFQKAKDLFQKVVQLNPEDKQARKMLLEIEKEKDL